MLARLCDIMEKRMREGVGGSEGKTKSRKGREGREGREERGVEESYELNRVMNKYKERERRERERKREGEGQRLGGG